MMSIIVFIPSLLLSVLLSIYIEQKTVSNSRIINNKKTATKIARNSYENSIVFICLQ